MRLTDNGKICAVNAKEQARLQKWQKAKQRRKQHDHNSGLHSRGIQKPAEN